MENSEAGRGLRSVSEQSTVFKRVGREPGHRNGSFEPRSEGDEGGDGARKVSRVESARQREEPGSSLLEGLRSLEEDGGLEQSGPGAGVRGWGGDEV